MSYVYAIESRRHEWSKWRRVTARPHGERFPFDPDTQELRFLDAGSANIAAASFRQANAGEFRTVSVPEQEK